MVRCHKTNFFVTESGHEKCTWHHLLENEFFRNLSDKKMVHGTMGMGWSDGGEDGFHVLDGFGDSVEECAADNAVADV